MLLCICTFVCSGIAHQDILSMFSLYIIRSGSEIQYQKVCESEFSDADFNSSCK